MRQFIVWHNSKSEYGTGSWAVIDGILFVRTCDGRRLPSSAARRAWAEHEIDAWVVSSRIAARDRAEAA